MEERLMTSAPRRVVPSCPLPLFRDRFQTTNFPCEGHVSPSYILGISSVNIFLCRGRGRVLSHVFLQSSMLSCRWLHYLLVTPR